MVDFHGIPEPFQTHDHVLVTIIAFRCNTLFIYHPTIRPYVIRATENVVR